MPKNKKTKSSSSDSDEGPIDRFEPPVSKKSKTDSGTAKQKNAAKSDDNEPTWELGGTKRAKVRVFKGKAYVDIREMYEKDGQLLPGKKGISLNPMQWRKLVSESEEITKAITEAC